MKAQQKKLSGCASNLLALENCCGFVTTDVLAKGLSRGAIATSYLKGVKPDKGHKDFYTSSAPSMKIKA